MKSSGTLSSTAKHIFGLTIIFCLLLSPLQSKTKRFEYPLGSIGGRVSIAVGDKDLLIEMLMPNQAGSKAGLRVGDRIIGLDQKRFPQMANIRESAERRSGPLETLGEAIDRVSGSGRNLSLMIERKGKKKNIKLRLPQNGSFNLDTFPYDCKKTKLIFDASCAYLASRLNKDWPRHWGKSSDLLTRGLATMALLGRTDKKYRKEAIASMTKIIEMSKNRKGLENWFAPWAGIFMCEYYYHFPSKKLLAEINQHAQYCSDIVVQSIGKPLTPHGPNAQYSPFCPLLTPSYVWFFSRAEGCGANTKTFKKGFELMTRHLMTKGMNKRGSVLYVPWKSVEKPMGPAVEGCSFRNGPAVIAMSFLREAHRLREGIKMTVKECDEMAKLMSDRMSVDGPGIMMDQHTVCVWPMAMGMAGIANYNRQNFIGIMSQYKWYFALSFEPEPASKGKRWVSGYIPGKQHNNGGDAYMNGVKEGFGWENTSVLMNSGVAFMLASSYGALSIYQDTPNLPGLSRSLLPSSLKKIYDHFKQKDYKKASKAISKLSSKLKDGEHVEAVKTMEAFLSAQTDFALTKMNKLIEKGDYLSLQIELDYAAKKLSGLSEDFDSRVESWQKKSKKGEWVAVIKLGKKLARMKQKDPDRTSKYYAKLYNLYQDSKESYYGREALGLIREALEREFSFLGEKTGDSKKFISQFKSIHKKFADVEPLDVSLDEALDDLAKNKTKTPDQIMEMWGSGIFLAKLKSED